MSSSSHTNYTEDRGRQGQFVTSLKLHEFTLARHGTLPLIGRENMLEIVSTRWRKTSYDPIFYGYEWIRAFQLPGAVDSADDGSAALLIYTIMKP